MNRILKIYSALWILTLAVFNAIVFLVPRELFGVDRWVQDGFWVGYALTTAALLAQLILTVICLRNYNPDRVFLNLSLPLTANGALLLSLVAGSVFMLFAAIPAWIGSIISLLLLLYCMIAVFNAHVSVRLVSGLDEKVRQQTAFIYAATAQAYNILQTANNDTRESAKKVWEALRYSDPMSTPKLANAEADIGSRLNIFANTVCSGDGTRTAEEAEQLLRLIRARNQDCKNQK